MSLQGARVEFEAVAMIGDIKDEWANTPEKAWGFEGGRRGSGGDG